MERYADASGAIEVFIGHKLYRIYPALPSALYSVEIPGNRRGVFVPESGNEIWQCGE